MDIKQTLEEISRIEKEKAQLELRQTQLSEKQDILAKKLAELGVSPQDLSDEISRLEAGIREKLEAIRKGPDKTAVVKTRSAKSPSDEEMMSALRLDN